MYAIRSYYEGNSVEISPDGQQIAIGEGNVARLFDVASGQQLAEFTGHRDVILGLAFSPDSQTLLTASWDSTARVWDAETGFEILALTGHTDQVSSARFSPDGNRILTTSQDGTARIWPFSVDELLRITSYNVCYTKLLRAIVLVRDNAGAFVQIAGA